MAQINIQNCTVEFVDGTSPTPLRLALIVGEGTLTWKGKRNIIYVLDREKLASTRKGPQAPLEVAFDLVWTKIQSDASDGNGANPSPLEVLRNIGAASAWVTTDSDVCKPFAIDIVITNDPNCGANTTETTTFANFRVEKVSYDPKTALLKFNGKCNVTTPTSVRS